MDDGTRIFTTDGANARIWDADSGNAVTTVRLHEDETFAEWRRDGARFAVIAGNDTKVRESATGAELALLQGHSGRVNSAKWSPDGTRIVTASDDHTVRIWDAATGSPIAILGDLHRKATICPPDCRLEDYIGPVTNADWSPDGTRILANLGNKFARVWDATRGRIVHNIYGASGTILWSPDGKQVLSFSPGRHGHDGAARWSYGDLRAAGNQLRGGRGDRQMGSTAG